MAHPVPSLDTARFTLRLWSEADIPDLLDLDDDPEVTRYVGPPRPRAEREAIWRGRLEDRARWPYLCVRDRLSGAFVGWATLRPFADGNGDWELGYRLRKSWWRQGVGSEVARALVEWGWAQPGIDVIGAVYDPRNVASRAILLKVGMQDAGMRDYFDEGPVDYCEARRPTPHQGCGPS